MSVSLKIHFTVLRKWWDCCQSPVRCQYSLCQSLYVCCSKYCQKLVIQWADVDVWQQL